MYNPSDYQKKKRENRILRRIVAVMATAMLFGIILCIGQAKAINYQVEVSTNTRCDMLDAYEAIDSLKNHIADLEGQVWRQSNLNGE